MRLEKETKGKGVNTLKQPLLIAHLHLIRVLTWISQFSMSKTASDDIYVLFMPNSYPRHPAENDTSHSVVDDPSHTGGGRYLTLTVVWLIKTDFSGCGSEVEFNDRLVIGAFLAAYNRCFIIVWPTIPQAIWRKDNVLGSEMDKNNI